MHESLNAGPGGYGPPPGGGGGGYGPPPGGGGGYGPPPGGGGGGYGPPPGGFGGGGYGAPPGGFGGGPFGPPGPQMPGAPMGPGFAPMGQQNGLAIAALVCGILAFPMSCCCSLASIPLAIAACVMGGMAMSKAKANPAVYGGKGMALGGLCCGAAALVLSIALLALGMGQALIEQYQRSH